MYISPHSTFYINEIQRTCITTFQEEYWVKFEFLFATIIVSDIEINFLTFKILLTINQLALEYKNSLQCNQIQQIAGQVGF